jgi:TonB family protein
MKLVCILASLLIHSLFFIKLRESNFISDVVTTTKEVIAIKVKADKKVKTSQSIKRKKKKSKLRNQKNNKTASSTKLIEAHSENIIKPIYPERARLLGLEGKSTVLVVIGIGGDIISVSLIKSSGYEILDDEVIRAVKLASFVAATKGGRPIKSEKEITFNYELE